MTPFVPVEVFVEEGCEGSTARTRQLAPEAPVHSFSGLPALLERVGRLPATEAKKRLVIASRAGGFVKDFPTGPGIRPSAWKYFIPAIGCPADCCYCFLQAYHPANVPVVIANQDAMLEEIKDALESGATYFYGGEMCDNLMLESHLCMIGPLVDLFSRHPGAVLELRTKSDAVGPLMAVRQIPNVVVSWTFSPESAAEPWEDGTAPLEKRVAAAARVERHGFRVGIRLDPIILSGDWRCGYERLVASLSASLEPEGVESVHLGGVRFTPDLKTVVERRRGRGAPFDGEFVRGPDGKLRYPRPLRTAAYAAIAAMIRDWASDIEIKLCMETPAVEDDFNRLLGGAAGSLG